MRLSDLPNTARKQRESSLEKYLVQIEDQSHLQEMLTFICNIKWTSLRTSDFLKLATSGKTSSASIQAFIEDTPVSHELVSIVNKSREVLIKDRFGCHVLRRMLTKSPYLFTQIKRLTLARFVEMASNECSSRVMQFIAVQDEHYRKNCIELFVSNWKRVITHVASNYLLSVCLKHTDNSSDAFKSIGAALYSKRHSLLEVKYDKRILVTYIEYCREPHLETFFNILRFNRQFVQRCDDKYMVYIFRLLLRRGHKQSERLLYLHLNTSLISCMATKYFETLLSEIFKDKKLHQQVRVYILQILVDQLPSQRSFDLLLAYLIKEDASSAVNLLESLRQTSFADDLTNCVLKSLSICLHPSTAK